MILYPASCILFLSSSASKKFLSFLACILCSANAVISDGISIFSSTIISNSQTFKNFFSNQWMMAITSSFGSLRYELIIDNTCGVFKSSHIASIISVQKSFHRTDVSWVSI
ncbi:MAG: hypothetical protein WCG25_09355 [bacterium]